MWLGHWQVAAYPKCARICRNTFLFGKYVIHVCCSWLLWELKCILTCSCSCFSGLYIDISYSSLTGEKTWWPQFYFALKIMKITSSMAFGTEFFLHLKLECKNVLFPSSFLIVFSCVCVYREEFFQIVNKSISNILGQWIVIPIVLRMFLVWGRDWQELNMYYSSNQTRYSESIKNLKLVLNQRFWEIISSSPIIKIPYLRGKENIQ